MQLQAHKNVNASKKLNRDGHNHQKSITTNAIKKEMEIANAQPLTCKRTDGRKWKCENNIVVPNTQCDYDSLQSCSSYYGPGTVVPRANSRPAPHKASASPIPAPVMASASSQRARDESAPSSSKEVCVPVSSNAALFAGTQSGSKQPRKRKIDDYLGGEFYYYEPFGPFRGKQRGTYSSSSNNSVEASVASIEEERSTHEDGSTKAT
ncbi:hypothetical protein BS78_01G480200 [Paspalum vaginatum]|nr:hypothetical protein BS78_01G480200 [Paspalum vaginatum]